MLQLAQLAIEMTGSKSTLSFQPLPQDDPKQRQPDISLATKHLGWQPTVSLREGLRHTIAYFDKVISGDRQAADNIKQLSDATGSPRAAA
jgi:UDP-glucuronate decarboxylase